MKISVIISTYNRPDALICVLNSLNQSRNLEFEAIIADDGSDEETKKAIFEFKKKARFNIEHVWHKDAGFQLAKIRNKAVARSSGDYLIFLDGDCVTFPGFIDKHSLLAEQGFFVRGSRVMLSKEYTSEFIRNNVDVSKFSFLRITKLRLGRKINRVFPLINLPLGMLRKHKKLKWYGAKGCNIAMWRKDYYDVNGFDEQYIGWGREDSDIVIRLMRKGVYRKEGVNAVTVLHLWHAMSDRAQLSDNDDRLQDIKNSNSVAAKIGISNYADQ